MRYHLTLLLVFSSVFVVAFGKHLHPRSIMEIDDDGTRIIDADVDGMSIDLIRRIKPSFVPVNNVLSFKSYPPCEVGFERDLRGVCREVW